MSDMKVYVCEEISCTLGTRREPAPFSGGITAQQVEILTGKPADSLEEGKDYGEGFCPNCGEKASKSEKVPAPAKGKDPNQKLHDEIRERVLDPGDSLTAAGAQKALIEAVEGKEGDD